MGTPARERLGGADGKKMEGRGHSLVTGMDGGGGSESLKNIAPSAVLPPTIPLVRGGIRRGVVGARKGMIYIYTYIENLAVVLYLCVRVCVLYIQCRYYQSGQFSERFSTFGKLYVVRYTTLYLCMYHNNIIITIIIIVYNSIMS